MTAAEQAPARRPARDAVSAPLRAALRALENGLLLQARQNISDALRAAEGLEHAPVDPCPRCASSEPRLTGADWYCTRCRFAWNPYLQTWEEA